MQTIRRSIAIVLVAGGAACASVSRIDQALPGSIDPGRIEVVEIATDPRGDVLLRGTLNGPEAPQARRGELTSTTGTEARGNAAIRDDEILVDMKRLPALAFMTLRVIGEAVLFFRTGDDGSASVKLTPSRPASRTPPPR